MANHRERPVSWDTAPRISCRIFVSLEFRRLGATPAQMRQLGANEPPGVPSRRTRRSDSITRRRGAGLPGGGRGGNPADPGRRSQPAVPGLLESDPVPLRDAAAHYRTAGPAVELPVAVKDLAAVPAERGQHEEARAALNEAVGLYESLNARWDIRRAYSRLRPYGIRRGVRGPRGPRSAAGWAALTPTELKSPPWSPQAAPRRRSPAACSCPGARCRPISRASWPSSAPRAGWRSSTKRCARASPPSGGAADRANKNGARHKVSRGQMASSASDLVTARPKAPNSCRSPYISMRMDWSRPPTRTGS